MKKNLFAGLMLVCAMLPAGQSAARAAEDAGPKKLRIIAFGAHPDDAEFKVGGCAIKWSKMGHAVKLVSVTNGDIGHWKEAGGALAIRRTAESKAAGKVLGAEYEVLDIHDGELMPTLENRKTITRLIRQWRADIVIAPRPWDYHPDHRYVGILVQDAAYMVAVPFICPDVPPLKSHPVFLYASDGFKKPYPFHPDISVSLDDVIDQKIDAVHELASQVYEGGCLASEKFVASVPPASDVAGRKAWLRKTRFETRYVAEVERARENLIKWYGPENGKKVKYCESFEICEYGRRPSDTEIRQLFPFLPRENLAHGRNGGNMAD